MNKAIKIGLTLVIIGLVLAVVFGVVSGEGFQTEEYTLVEQNYTVDQFDMFSFDLENKAVTVQTTDSNTVTVTYYVSERDAINVTENGTSISFVEDVEWYNWFVFGFSWFQDPAVDHVIISIPADLMVSFEIVTSNGAITMEGLNAIQSLDLDTSNGGIELTDLAIAENLVAHSSNGGLDLTNLAVDGTIVATTSNGKVDVSGLVAESVDLRTSNGNMICSSVQTDELSLDTSNGSITVNVAGVFEDYSLTMMTTNGHYEINGETVVINHYHDDASKSIECVTSNGNIYINFSQ